MTLVERTWNLVGSVSRPLVDHLRARETESRVAIADAAEALTYSELVTRVRELSGDLQNHGIRAGDRVCVILDNSIDFVALAFAVWDRGATLVPFSAAWRAGEVLAYLEIIRPVAVICGTDTQALLDDLKWWRVGGANSGLVGGTMPPSHQATIVNGHAPAVLHLSSGSTGLPKLAARSQAQLLGEAEAMAVVLALTPADVIVGAIPFCHGYGLGCAVLLPLLNGATLRVVSKYAPDTFGKTLERCNVTGIPGVPFMFQHLAESDTPWKLSGIRYATSSGVPLSSTVATGIRARYGIRIRNQYGASETGPIAVSVDSDYLDGGQVAGYAIPGVTISIVAADGLMEDEGLVSVTSPYASKGYENVPDGSESGFVDGSFMPGDVGRFLPDGQLVLMGRNRRFVNVAGQKVDPREIEAVIRGCPGVKDATVFGIRDDSCGELLKAVAAADDPIAPWMIMAHCRGQLATYKLPAVITVMRDLPRGPTGKVLRKYLV